MNSALYLAVIFVTACWLTWRFTKWRHEKYIAALLKQVQAKAGAASQQAFSSRELFTLDWANQLLEASWAPALEQVVSAKLTATLEVRKGPLRYLERVKVDKMKLGRRPPLLSSCTAATDATTGSVRLALPFSFEPTEGFSVVLALYVRPAKLLPAFATCVAVTSFSMKGELLLDFLTSPEKPPGISTLGVSFAQPPTIDFNFHTFALAFGDLPFLLDMLKELARKALNAKMVEPQKLSINLAQRWARQESTTPAPKPRAPARDYIPAEQAAAPLQSPANLGHGTVMDLHQTWRALWPLGRKPVAPADAASLANARQTSAAAMIASAASADALNAVTATEATLQAERAGAGLAFSRSAETSDAMGASAIAINASAASADALNAVPSPGAHGHPRKASPTIAYGGPASLTAATAHALAQAPDTAIALEKVIAATVHVAAFAQDAQAAAEQLQPIRESGETAEVPIDVTGAKGHDAHGTAINEDSAPIVTSARRRSTREHARRRSTREHHASDAPSTWGSLHENDLYLEEKRVTRSTRESRSSMADELPDRFLLVDTASTIPVDLHDVDMRALDTAGDTKDFVPEPGLGFQPESRRHSFDKQEGLAEVALLEANLAAIQKRMAAEQLRALIEGAPFVVHAASGACLQYLSLQKQTGNLLCGQERRCEQQSLSKESARKSDAPVTLRAEDILDIKAGCAVFPKEPSRRSSWMTFKGLLAQPRRSSASSSSSGKLSLHIAEDSRCFSILAESHSLHLELPKGGNGRSRREWMDAIAGLAVLNIASSNAVAKNGTATQMLADKKGPRTISADV